MGLKIFVKVSNVNDLSTARYCSGMGVNVLGINVEDGSEGFVSPEKFSEMSAWLSGVEYAAEFETYTAEEIKLAIAHYKVDYIQTSRADTLEALKDLGIPIILKLNGPIESLKSSIKLHSAHVDFFIIKSDFESDVLEKYDFRNVLINNSHLNASNALDFISKAIKGIELMASDEIKPGFGDFDKIADILEVLEVD